jgi:hypothetical protein
LEFARAVHPFSFSFPPQPSPSDQVIDSSSFPVEEGSWSSFALLGVKKKGGIRQFRPLRARQKPISFLPRARVCTSGVRSLVSWEPRPEEEEEDGSGAAA